MRLLGTVPTTNEYVFRVLLRCWECLECLDQAGRADNVPTLHHGTIRTNFMAGHAAKLFGHLLKRFLNAQDLLGYDSFQSQDLIALLVPDSLNGLSVLVHLSEKI